MMFRLFCFLVGYARITIADRAEAAATLFLRQSVNVADSKRGEGGRLSFTVPLYRLSKMLALLDNYRFSVESVERGGLPAEIRARRGRIGLWLGLPASAAILIAGSLFLWQVRIVGCETVSEEEVRRLLAAEGVAVGSFIPPIDAIATAGRVQIASGNIAFLAVNIIGTTCEVQVTETSRPPADATDDRPASLVADFDGLIERIELYDGQVTVKPGEAVRKGQVLISGLCQLDEDRWRLTAAKGKVYARVERTLTAEVLLKEEKQVPAGEILLSRSLIFFKKSLKISETSSILPPTYGTIEKIDALALPDGRPLPVGIAETYGRLWRTETITRTPAKAEQLANRQLADLAADLLAEDEILSLTRSVEVKQDRVILTWKVYCITDIAKVMPMTGLPAQ